MKTKKRRIRAAAILLALCAAALAAAVVWTVGGYPADGDALRVIDETPGVTVLEGEENRPIVFEPENAGAGLIFYPGARVGYEAYAPLMARCAEEGFLCVLLQMPADLAILDADAARGIPAQYPQVERWYVGGHSLGGAMAASCAAKYPEQFDGLILLAAYSTKDIRQSGLQVLSIYGSEDGVLNRDSYEKYRQNLPDGFTELMIPGGCHAYFGSYGPQKGDGVPTIDRDAQLDATAAAIGALLDAAEGKEETA